MKLLVLIALCIIAVASKKINPEHVKEWKGIIKNIEESCIEEHKTDKQVIKEMLEDLKYPEDKSLKCYWYCLHDKLKLLKPDGSMDLDLVLKKTTFISKELGMKCIEDHKMEKDHCERSYKLVKCVIDAIAV